MWKSWKRSCSWMAPHTWTSSLPTPLMKNLQGWPPGLGTRRPSRIWVENQNIHECKHTHSHGQASLMPSSLYEHVVVALSALQLAYSSTFSRWNCAESFLLWHLWSHWHHGPRDRSQSRPLPRVSGYIGGGIVQRRVSGDWALDGNWRSVRRHQPHSQIQRLPRSWSRQWNLWVPGLHAHALQQLHELCWWAINRKFTPYRSYPDWALTTSVACRRLLHGLLHPEPGGEDALLPGPHLPDLAAGVQTLPRTNAAASGGTAS